MNNKYEELVSRLIELYGGTNPPFTSLNLDFYAKGVNDAIQIVSEYKECFKEEENGKK